MIDQRPRSGITDSAELRNARPGHTAEKRVSSLPCCRPGYPDHGDAGASMRGTQCENRFGPHPGLPKKAGSGRLSGVHRVEELAVRLGLPKLVEQELDRILRAHRVENATENIGLLQLIARRDEALPCACRT